MKGFAHEYESHNNSPSSLRKSYLAKKFSPNGMNIQSFDSAAFTQREFNQDSFLNKTPMRSINSKNEDYAERIRRA